MLLPLHNIVRWLVLALAVNALWRALRGVNGKTPYDTGARRAVSFFVMSMHVQLLLGLAVYGTSPLIHTAMQDMASTMKTASVRYFVVEHPTLMLASVVVATITSVLARRGPDDEVKHRRAAIGVACSLGLALAGIPWNRALWPQG